MKKEVDKDLFRLGEDIVSTIDAAGRKCEENPPKLTSFDAWGTRIDQIETCNEWNSMKTISAEEGFIAIGYDESYGEYRFLTINLRHKN